MSAAAQDTPLLTKSPKRSKFRLYYELNRLHKFPAGIILVFWPCVWSLTMASYRTLRDPADYLWDLILYGFASTLVHSAACVLNDICDRDLDRQERTKNRPLASGAISISGAATCLMLELSICITLLASTMDFFIFAVGFIGIFPLHGLYPLMKRYTYWPQAWLGLAMNWGYILVWVLLIRDNDDYTIPSVFFFGTICWTIVYDTIYGCQDRVDDIKAGIKSTSLLFGGYVRPILAIFASLFVAAVAYAGHLNRQGPAYYVITVGGTSLHLAWQLITLKPNQPADCWSKFESNGTLGFIAWVGMLVDYMQASGTQ